MFFLSSDRSKSYFLAFLFTNTEGFKTIFSIRNLLNYITLLSAIFLLSSILPLHSSSVRLNSEKIANALIYSDAGMWDEVSDIIDGILDESVHDLFNWLKLRKGEGSKSDYVNFIQKNPHWPGMKLLKLNAEKKIYKDYDEKRIKLDESLLVLFSDGSPQSGEGLLILAEVLSRMGEFDSLANSITHLWPTLKFTDACLIEFVAKYSAKYDLDYSKRVEELLWNNEATSVEQIMKLTPYQMSTTQKVRLKLQNFDKGITNDLAKLTTKQVLEPGLVFDRLRYKMRKKFLDSATEFILINGNKNSEGLGRANKWAGFRIKLVKYNLQKSNFLEAYEISRNHYLSRSEGSYYQLEWLSGFIAYQYLNKYPSAVYHFQNALETANSFESKAKVKYFLGKTYGKTGEKKLEDLALQEASLFFDTIHGQVSQESLKDQALSLPQSQKIEHETVSPITALDTVKLGFLLSHSGRVVLGDWFFQHSAKSFNKAEKFEFIKILDDAGYHMSVISIIKRYDMLRYGSLSKNYPIPSFWETSGRTLKGIQLAIAREESKFYKGSRSPTNAQGLMQLMPKTAQMMAVELKTPYFPRRLRSDWKYNLELGSHYMEKLLKRYDFSLPLALAAYNAGPARVNSWLRLYGDPRENTLDFLSWIQCIPFDETRGYVSRVLASIVIYNGILNGVAPSSNYITSNFSLQLE